MFFLLPINFAKLKIMLTVFNQSIWGDEGFSAILSMKSVPEILKIISRDTSPPLWNLTEHLAFQIFGRSEIVIRSLAFLYFLGAVFFTYKIGRFFWDKKTAIISSILIFLNPFFFTYAFEGRMYSILALGVTASMYFFLKILFDQKASTKNIVGYVIATLWAMYSHHFAIFALFIQFAWFLKELATRNFQFTKKMFKGFILVAIGYLPWLIPLYNQTKMVGGGFWLGTPTLKELFGLILEYLAAGIRNESLKLPLANTTLYQVCLYLTISTLLIRNWRKNIKKTLFLLSWFLGPIIVTWIVSQFFQSIFFNRYLLYTIPGAMLVLASERRKIISISLIILIIILFAIIDLNYFTHPTKRPFRQLATYVLQTKNREDFLINWNSSSHHLWETKYYRIPAPIYIPEGGELPFFVGTALMEKEDITHKIPQKAKRVGVVTSGDVEEVTIPGYTESEVKIFKNPWEGASEIKFIWYEKLY
jgi:4-amino-4-deoxy-L-arabinose transferase-like glycosyltransferase